MKTAIILHGTPSREEYYDRNTPSPSNHHWIPWLQKQLLVQGYSAHTPEMPNAWAPLYLTWKKEFERFDITDETLLVGHSCGGGFLVRWLSEHPNSRLDKVVLVAPWLDPQRTKTTDFFDFELDPDLASRTNKFMIFNSDNDGDDIQESVRRILKVIRNGAYREFHGYGHFCLNDLKTGEFPELLEILIGN